MLPKGDRPVPQQRACYLGFDQVVYRPLSIAPLHLHPSVSLARSSSVSAVNSPSPPPIPPTRLSQYYRKFSLVFLSKKISDSEKHEKRSTMDAMPYCVPFSSMWTKFKARRSAPVIGMHYPSFDLCLAAGCVCCTDCVWRGAVGQDHSHQAGVEGRYPNHLRKRGRRATWNDSSRYVRGVTHLFTLPFVFSLSLPPFVRWRVGRALSCIRLGFC